MNAKEKIVSTFDRISNAIRARPSIAQGTAVTNVTVTDGLACRISDGRWSLVCDLSEKSGGDGLGPDPGVFGRTALGSCLAMTYVRWAHLLDVPIDRIEVEVQTDYDARGEYDIGNVMPDYSAIRYVVKVDSPAPQGDITRMLDKADRHCAYLHVFSRPQKMKRIVQINQLESS